MNDTEMLDKILDILENESYYFSEEISKKNYESGFQDGKAVLAIKILKTIGFLPGGLQWQHYIW